MKFWSHRIPKTKYSIEQWMRHDREDKSLDWTRAEMTDRRSPLADSGTSGSCHDGHVCNTAKRRLANQHMLRYRCSQCSIVLAYIPKKGSSGSHRAPTKLEPDHNPQGQASLVSGVPTASVNKIRLDKEAAQETKMEKQAKAKAKAAAKEAADRVYKEAMDQAVRQKDQETHPSESPTPPPPPTRGDQAISVPRPRVLQHQLPRGCGRPRKAGSSSWNRIWCQRLRADAVTRRKAIR